MYEKSERIKINLEKELGRKLKPQEAFILGYTYSMAFADGKMEALKALKG